MYVLKSELMTDTKEEGEILARIVSIGIFISNYLQQQQLFTSKA